MTPTGLRNQIGQLSPAGKGAFDTGLARLGIILDDDSVVQSIKDLETVMTASEGLSKVRGGSQTAFLLDNTRQGGLDMMLSSLWTGQALQDIGRLVYRNVSQAGLTPVTIGLGVLMSIFGKNDYAKFIHPRIRYVEGFGERMPSLETVIKLHDSTRVARSVATRSATKAKKNYEELAEKEQELKQSISNITNPFRNRD